MNTFAAIALMSWIPISVALFVVMKPRRALLTCYLVGWLFLPWLEYELEALPWVLKLSKPNVVAVGAMLGILAVDGKRLLTLRPHVTDLPMIVWCAIPFASSLSNELGAYDGFTGVVDRVFKWGFPYIAGRLYFRDTSSHRELAIAVFVSGLIYVPFCLFEIRMSPQLHRIVYGVHTRWGGMRFGGWRPSVFMENGLALGLWMTTSTLAGFWLYTCGALRRLGGIPVSPLAAVLLGTTIFCKSFGALCLLMLGIGALYGSRVTRNPLPLILLAVAPLMYMTARTFHLWSGESAVAALAAVSEERAESLRYRLFHEDHLTKKALERPILGWGSWGRNMVQDAEGESISVMDSLWIITLGTNGLIGLAALTGVLVLPVLSWLWNAHPRRWASPELAAAGVLSVSLLIFLCDNLMNDMINPAFALVAGALSGPLRPRGRRQVLMKGRPSTRRRPEALTAVVEGRNQHGSS